MPTLSAASVWAGPLAFVISNPLPVREAYRKNWGVAGENVKGAMGR